MPLNKYLKQNTNLLKGDFVENKILFLKALADKTRILIINILMQRESYVEEISEILDMSPSTISFHMKKLEDAGIIDSYKDQYYTVYRLKKEALNIKISDKIKVENVENVSREEKLKEYREKIIKSFFEYGKLKNIPAQRKKRKIILEYILNDFRKDKDYTEHEVNIILVKYHDDVASLRRHMIEEHLMSRSEGIYRLE